MNTALPERPDLEQLRHRAKELLRAARAGDPDALDRFRAQLPLRPGAAVRLSTAQLVIAREHGFASWPALVAQIEAASAGLVGSGSPTWRHTQRARAFRPARRPGRWSRRARSCCPSIPEAVGYDIRVAAVLGDAAAARRLLAADPGLATRPTTGRLAATAVRLLRPAGTGSTRRRSGWPGRGGRAAAGRGRRPNTAVEGSARGRALRRPVRRCRAGQPCRVGTAAAANAAPTPTPRGALPHGVPPRPRLPAATAAARRPTEGPDALGAAISIADTTAIRLLLEAGIDPTQPIPADAFGEAGHGQPPIPAVRAALQWHCDTTAVDLLLTHGAVPDDASDEGLSSYRLAVRRGDPALTETLRRHGARDDSSAVDRLLGACAAADRAAVEPSSPSTPRCWRRCPGTITRCSWTPPNTSA